MNLDKNLYVCKLIDTYGMLLKDSQQKVLKSYYFDDYSLSELSALQNVSRQAISESINSAIDKLEMYEQKLHKIQIREILEQMTVENFEKSKQILNDLM